MIQIDHKNCQIKWFQLKYLCITKIPSRGWFAQNDEKQKITVHAFMFDSLALSFTYKYVCGHK